MAEKRNFAEEITEKLLCHTCRIVPDTENPESFLCRSQKHVYCKSCFKNAKCCKKADPKSCELISSVMKNLPQFCKHFVNGCRETLSKSEKEDHEKNCTARTVSCVVINCNEEIAFHGFWNHMNSEHEEIMSYQTMKFGETTELIECFDFSRETFEKYKWHVNWSPVEITIDEQKFYLTGRTFWGNSHFWLCFYGSTNEAKNFVYKLSVQVDESCLLTFSGEVLTLAEDNFDIPKEKPTFGITKNNMLKLMQNPNADKSFMYLKIRNLKNEAKDDNEESGISDDSD